MTKRDKNRIKRYFQITWKNKMLAIGMLLTGYLSTLIDGDWTWFILMIFIGVQIFFYKEDIFEYYEEQDE